MEGKEGKDVDHGKSFFFKRKASRKTHHDCQATENSSSSASSNHNMSASVKSSTLPSNRQDRGACSVPPSPSEGLFSKLKRKFKIRSSRGKYDLKDLEHQPPRVRRKSDDPNMMKESREEEGEDTKVTSSVKTPRRTQSDKEDVILIRKNKRVSVLCKTGDKEPEIIFSNVMNSEDDECESFGEGGEEDPYATINSVKDEIKDKFPGADGKKKAEKLEKDRAKARELLSQSIKDTSGANGGKALSPGVVKVEDLYAKIKPKEKNSLTENSNSDTATSATNLDVAEFNRLAEARLKSRLEPQYETLDDVRQRTSLMYEGVDDGYEDLSHASSVTEEGTPSMSIEPDYETLDDVKQRVATENSLSSSSSKTETTATTAARKQSSSHYSKLFGSKSSKLSGSMKSTSASSFSMTDQCPVEASGATKDYKLDGAQRETPPVTRASSQEGKINEIEKDASQKSPKGPAPLASSIDSSIPTEESASSSDSPTSECIYDNPNIILRKQMNKQNLSPLSPGGRHSCNLLTQRTPAEEELVEKLSSLLAPPLPLRNYMKDEVSRAGGSTRHSWAPPSSKFWDMSESWHGSDFGRGGNLLNASTEFKLKMAEKSKSQELFEGSKDEDKSSQHSRRKRLEIGYSEESHDGEDAASSKQETLDKKLTSQMRIIPIRRSPGLTSNSNVSDSSINASKEKISESSDLRSEATRSTSPPFRILPINISPRSSQTGSLSPSSNKSDKDVTTENDVNGLKFPEVTTCLQSSIIEEITEDVDSDLTEEESKVSSSEATKAQLTNEKLKYLPSSDEISRLNNTSKEEHQGDDKMNSFISPDTFLQEVRNTVCLQPDEQSSLSSQFDSDTKGDPTLTFDAKDSMSASDAKDSALASDTKVSALASDTKDSALASDTKDSALASDTKDSALASDIKDSALASDAKDSILASDAKDSALSSPTEDSALASDTKDSALASDMKDSMLASDTKDSALSSHTKDSVLASNTKNSALSSHSKDSPLASDCVQDVINVTAISTQLELGIADAVVCEENSGQQMVNGDFLLPVSSLANGTHLKNPADSPSSDENSRSDFNGQREEGEDELDENEAINEMDDEALLSMSKCPTEKSQQTNPTHSQQFLSNDMPQCVTGRLLSNWYSPHDYSLPNGSFNTELPRRDLIRSVQQDQPLSASMSSATSSSVNSDSFQTSRPGNSMTDDPDMRVRGGWSIDYDTIYADMDSSEGSDPLGDLEQYNENAPSLYLSDSSDGFASSNHFEKWHSPNQLSQNDPRFQTGQSPSDEDDNDFHFMHTGRDHKSKKTSRADEYPYSSYTKSDFENAFPHRQVASNIWDILLKRPVLLENIINGHFCSYIGINPFYMKHSRFRWSRIFALPLEDMAKVERKLCLLFQRTKVSLFHKHSKTFKVDQYFEDKDYWTVVNYLKIIQDQPTFQNIRYSILGTDQLIKFHHHFRKSPTLPCLLDRIIDIEHFRVNEEEFRTSCETAPSYCSRYAGFSQDCFSEPAPQEASKEVAADEVMVMEGAAKGNADKEVTAEEIATLNSSQLSNSFSGGSLSLLSDFLELCDNNHAMVSGCQDEYDSDEDDEEETVGTYIDCVGMSLVEAQSYSADSWATVLSFCRALRGELAYMARLRPPGQGVKRKLAPWTCSGMDSHLSFSAWEEMDQLMKKLVPHMSPRLDFQFLLRLYSEFKYFILKDRQRNKQCRGCFFVEFDDGVRCSKKEEFVFLKLLRDELCYFSHLIRGCKATESLFLEEHSVAYSLTRLLTLVLETLWMMKQSIHQVSAEADNAGKLDATMAANATEAFSRVQDFDHYHPRLTSFSLGVKDKLSFHLANYKAFRTSSMWYDLQDWMQPSDFLDDPNLLQGNSSVFTHADNAIHVAQFGGYDDPKPLHEKEGFTESMQQLRTKEWYWGPLSYEQAILVLKDHRDGTFLVRDSSDKKYLLSLSFISLGEVHHTRIEHAKGLFSFWSQPESHTKGSICEFIDISVQNSKDGRFLYFLRPSARGTPPIPIRLLYPLSRNFRVPSLKHLSRFAIRQSVRIDHIRRLPLPQKVKTYLLEKQYFVEILIDDNWAFEREGSVPL